MRVKDEALLRLTNSHNLLDRLCYEIAWRPQLLEKDDSNSESLFPEYLTVFTDKTGVGDNLVKQLTEQGISCVQVFAGDGYKVINKYQYEINPALLDDYKKLFHEVQVEHSEKCHGLIHLWSLDAAERYKYRKSSLMDIQSHTCGSVLHMLQGLSVELIEESSHLWLVTRGSQALQGDSSENILLQTSVWGLGSVIVNEFSDLTCVRVDLDPTSKDDNENQLLIDEILLRKGDDDQVAYRSNKRYVPRLTSLDLCLDLKQDSGSFAPMLELRASESGVLEDLSWQPTVHHGLNPGEVEIQVCSAGLNFRDVLGALNVLNEDKIPLGCECSGLIVGVGDGVKEFQLGDKVAAFASGSFRSTINVVEEMVVHKPDNMSFFEAASVPVVFLTAHYALRYLTQILEGERILIHAAAGGVGLAAVQIAKLAGAEIYATAGSPEKRNFLKQFGVQNVMDSRSLDFAEEIFELTEGRGVHVVLNSLSGDFIPKSLLVLQPGGRFFEIGKRDIWSESQVHELRNDVSYATFDLGTEARKNPGLIKSMFCELIDEFKSGTLKPLPQKTFTNNDVAKAFRYMAQAKHIGKIVVSFQDRKEKKETHFNEIFHSDGNYLITGGLGGLGIQTARWMVDNGARYISLIGRQGSSKSSAEILDNLKRDGAQVAIFQADVSDRKQLEKILDEIKHSMQPLRGIIHAAGVIDDGVLLQQSWQRFAKVFAPKMEGAWNLHILTENEPLDFFVMFSSASSVIGWPGQGNYAAANAFMDSLAHYRQAAGLPALSINWGPWSEIGMAADMKANKLKQLTDKGLQGIDPNKGFLALSEMLCQERAQVVAFSVKWEEFLKHFYTGSNKSFYTEFIDRIPEEAKKAKRAEKNIDLFNLLDKTPASNKLKILSEYIKREAAIILGLDPEKPLNWQQPLNEIGLDSLLAVELRNVLSANLNQNLPGTLLFDYPTIDNIAQYLATVVFTLDSKTEEVDSRGVKSFETNVDPGVDFSDLEELSEEEAEALLMQELSRTKRER